MSDFKWLAVPNILLNTIIHRAAHRQKGKAQSARRRIRTTSRHLEIPVLNKITLVGRQIKTQKRTEMILMKNSPRP